jgi:septum formation topological specificity factor MinE
MDIKFTDVLIVLATLIGPVFAVQAQKWLERGREVKNGQLRVFKTLMATRAVNLSPSHVEALNSVPIEFYGKSGQLKTINIKWKIYFDHLLINTQTTANWEEKRRQLLYDLLLVMSKYLEYDFDEVEIKKVYAPQGHQVIETDQEIIRAGLAALFKGHASLPIEIKTSSKNSEGENQ